MQSVKDFLKKLTPEDDVRAELACYLLTQRATRGKNGKSPSEMLLGRQIETYFDKLRPKKKRTFEKGRYEPMSPVWARTYKENTKSWTMGQILKQVGSVVYMVELEDGKLVKRHLNQLRLRVEEDPFAPVAREDDPEPTPQQQREDSESSDQYEDAEEVEQAVAEPAAAHQQPVAAGAERRSKRARKQTEFYGQV